MTPKTVDRSWERCWACRSRYSERVSEEKRGPTVEAFRHKSVGGQTGKGRANSFGGWARRGGRQDCQIDRGIRHQFGGKFRSFTTVRPAQQGRVEKTRLDHGGIRHAQANGCQGVAPGRVQELLCLGKGFAHHSELQRDAHDRELTGDMLRRTLRPFQADQSISIAQPGLGNVQPALALGIDSGGGPGSTRPARNASSGSLPRMGTNCRRMFLRRAASRIMSTERPSTLPSARIIWYGGALSMPTRRGRSGVLPTGRPMNHKTARNTITTANRPEMSFSREVRSLRALPMGAFLMGFRHCLPGNR